MFIPKQLISALFLSLGLVTSARAQSTEPPPPPPVAPDQQATLPTVQVSASQDAYDPRRHDTATKIVVTEEEITKHGDTTLADVLKRQPGVTISGGNAGRGGGEIRMRGLGSGYTQILLNGEPAPPGFTLDDIAPSLIERIEIVRAATAEFSTQAIAGTVNIVLKKKFASAKRELKFTGAGSNTYRSASVDGLWSDKVGILSYAVGANARRGRFEDRTEIHDTGTDSEGLAQLQRHASEAGRGHFSSYSLNPRLTWNLPGGDSIASQTFVNVNQNDYLGATDWFTELGAAPLYPIDRTQYDGKASMLRTDLNWVRKLPDGSKLDAKFGLNASRRDWVHFEQGYTPAAVQTLSRTTPGSAHDQGQSTQGKYTTPVVEDHTLAMGWDLARSQRTETRREHDVPLPGQTPFSSDLSFNATLTKTALYAQDEWSITPKWSLYVGLRWEGLDTRSAGNTFEQVHNTSQVLSPLLQTLWKLPNSHNDQLRLALTRTYKAPGIGRIIPRPFTVSNNSALTPDFRGNPNLMPELATGLDLAYEHFFGEGASFSASVYRRQLSGVIRDITALVDTRWVTMPTNSGRALAQGLEVDAKLPLQVLFGKSAPQLDLRTNLALNTSTVDGVPGPNNRLADQTPLSFNAGVDYKPNGRFGTGGNLTFKRAGPVQLSATNSRYAGVRRELDLYALYKFDAQTQLRVAAANVLAQAYSSQSQYEDASGTLTTSAKSASTASLRVTLELKL